jgi:predicted tellurium resistance membrane protein TerC
VDELGVMIAAVVIAVGIMMVSAGAISNFVNQHPTLKMLALSFLLLVGFVLVLEGFDQHISKGYIYFAMAFSVFVEFLNIRIYRRRRQEQPVDLHQRYSEQGESQSESGGP